MAARRALLGQLVALLAGSTTCLGADATRPGGVACPGSVAEDRSSQILRDAPAERPAAEGLERARQPRPRSPPPRERQDLGRGGGRAGFAQARRPRVVGHPGRSRLLRDLTTEIPIVMVGAGDPVGTGLVASLARPGGNVTGVSWQLDDLIPKTLSLLHEMVPRAKRVDLVNQAGDPSHAVFAKGMLDAARSRGLECQVFQVRNEDELVTTIAGSTADALLMRRHPDDLCPSGAHCRGRRGTGPADRHHRRTRTRPDREGHPVLLLRQPGGALPSRGRLHRPHPAWRQGGRHSGGATCCATTSSSTSRPRAPWD